MGNCYIKTTRVASEDDQYENGEAINTVSCSWKGYFQNLNNVEVHRVKSII